MQRIKYLLSENEGFSNSQLVENLLKNKETQVNEIGIIRT